MHFVQNVGKKRVHFSPGGANNIIQKLEGVFFFFNKCVFMISITIKWTGNTVSD